MLYDKNLLPLHFLKFETIEEDLLNKAKNLDLNPKKYKRFFHK